MRQERRDARAISYRFPDAASFIMAAPPKSMSRFFRVRAFAVSRVTRSLPLDCRSIINILVYNGFFLATHAAKMRSEEHTSELQSLMRNSYAVFCLKKKKDTKNHKERISH